MIKQIGVAGFAALALVGGAGAQSCTCSGLGSTRVLGPALVAALSGNTVCVPKGAEWEWQEQHRTASPGASSGQLWDFKRGAGHPIDPTERVGSWSVVDSSTSRGALVNHSYLGGSAFSYQVCRVGTTTSYGFCSVLGAPIIMSTVKPGAGAGCP